MSVAETRSGPRPGTAAPLVLHARNLAKSFGPTVALREASFELRSGEIHALVGENGSGKSTLVKILSGVHHPDRGVIEAAGRETPLATPRTAQANGIVTVFQEVLVIENQSVLDNLWLGTDRFFRAGVPEKQRRQRARECLAELLENPPALDARMEDL
jgi:ABC-type sugar transport system ATPase subunit